MAVTQVHFIVDQDLAPSLGDHLGAHGRVGAVERLRGVEDPLTRVRFDAVHVRALEEIGEEPDELGLLFPAATGPVAGEGAAGNLVEVEELARDPLDLDPPVARNTATGIGLLEHVDDTHHGRLHGLAWTRRGRCHRPGHHQPRGKCLTHGPASPPWSQHGPCHLTALKDPCNINAVDGPNAGSRNP